MSGWERPEQKNIYMSRQVCWRAVPDPDPKHLEPFLTDVRLRHRCSSIRYAFPVEYFPWVLAERGRCLRLAALQRASVNTGEILPYIFVTFKMASEGDLEEAFRAVRLQF